MTIVLQMPPGLEASLRDRAAREGVDASTLVLRTLEQQFGSSADAQTDLLLRLNEGPSEEVWRRYHELSAKRDSETLPSEQHDELIGLSQIIEAADVKRLEYMADLAKLRGVGLRALRAELGITDRHTVGEQNNV
jgi:hypothetical protein